MSLLLTGLALLRFFVLVAWCVYALFENRPKRLMFALVVALMIPNFVGVMIGMFGP